MGAAARNEEWNCLPLCFETELQQVIHRGELVRVLNIGMVHQNSLESLRRNALVRPREEPPQKPRDVSPPVGSTPKKKYKDDGKKDKDRRYRKPKGRQLMAEITTGRLLLTPPNPNKYTLRFRDVPVSWT
jgi:hypothetical protein